LRHNPARYNAIMESKHTIHNPHPALRCGLIIKGTA
jgi:hypothetical protein